MSKLGGVRILACCLSLSLVFAVTGASAQARIRIVHMHRLGTTLSEVISDGAGWAAYEPSPDVTHVIDVSTRQAFYRSNPPGCEVPQPWGVGGLIEIGSGELLYGCHDPECAMDESQCTVFQGPSYLTHTRLVVMDAASGKEHLVPGTSVLPAFEFGTAITAIGSRWIAGDAMAYHGQRPFYLDWHTGRVVVEPRESATNIGTLDLPLVRHNLCGPLRRIRNTEVWGPPFEPLLYSPPFAVDQTHRAGEYTRLRLLHCGSSRSELLPSTETWGPQLGGDVLSWVASGKNESPFVTRLYPNGPRWHGPLFQLVGPHQPYETGTERVRWSRPQHTSTSIYLTEDQWEAPTYKITSTLWSARIP